jgi:hypothetical protein
LFKEDIKVLNKTINNLTRKVAGQSTSQQKCSQSGNAVNEEPIQADGIG